jgi:hypothetical protein
MFRKLIFVFLFVLRFIPVSISQERFVLHELSEGWGAGLNYGITQFNGDIKSNGLYVDGAINSILIFSIEKSINNSINLNAHIGLGGLNGSRRHDTYVLSETTNNLNDPYKNYEGNGVKFSSDIYEIAVISKIDLEEVYLYFRPYFRKRENIHFYYNLGYGEILYKSMKRNMESGTYIYAYGYDDLNGNYESYKKLVKSKLFIYGFSVEYNINKNINLELSSVSRLSFTDHLDATEIKRGFFTSNDLYRVISLGMKYIFN